MKLTKDDVNRFVDKRGWSDDDEYIKLSRLREVVKELLAYTEEVGDDATAIDDNIYELFGEVLE